MATTVRTIILGTVIAAVGYVWGAGQEEAKEANAVVAGGLLARVEMLESIETPVGAILSFAGSTIPVGYLVCDGAAHSKQEHPELAALLGETWGNAEDGKFLVPDLRAEFLRGADDMATPAGPRGISPESRLGKYQGDAFAKHLHSCVNVYHISGTIGPLQPGPPPYTNNALIAGYPYGFYGDAKGAIINTEKNRVSEHPKPFKGGFEGALDADGRRLDKRMAITSSVGAGETRPRNASVIFLIKARAAVQRSVDIK